MAATHDKSAASEMHLPLPMPESRNDGAVFRNLDSAVVAANAAPSGLARPPPERPGIGARGAETRCDGGMRPVIACPSIVGIHLVNRHTFLHREHDARDGEDNGDNYRKLHSNVLLALRMGRRQHNGRLGVAVTATDYPKRRLEIRRVSSGEIWGVRKIRGKNPRIQLKHFTTPISGGSRNHGDRFAIIALAAEVHVAQLPVVLRPQ